MRYDYAVCGNGPVGSYAAMCAAGDGDVALIGKKIEDIRCAGLISKSGLAKLGLLSCDFILNKVRGSKIFSPDGTEIFIDGRKTKALVVDRIGFDNHVIDLATDAGAVYIDDWVTGIRPEMTLKNGGELKAGEKILAAGTVYTIQHDAGIPTPNEYLMGGQYEMNVECDPDFVELHFDVPDFFAWVIPVGDHARVGLCVKGNPRPYLDAFVKKLEAAGRIRSSKRLSESFGVIPVHSPSFKAQYGDIRLVGDAAGHVKATTGGGIVLGCMCAKHATESDYERQWRSEAGSELRMHLFIHRFLNRLSDRGKDRFFGLLSRYNTILEESGDMDYAKKTVMSLLRNPGFAARSAVTLPWVLADIV